MTGALAVCLLVALVATCGGYPTQLKQATSPGAFIGEGINNIATALLQDSEKEGNAAFSPLGHSAILAALVEGASGETRSQMLAALKLPQDSSLTRATYRAVLGRMREKNAVNKPEFRTWFYVYKKTAQVEDSYTTLLRDSYLMEVRDIESIELDTPTEFFTKKEQQIKDGKPDVNTDKKDEQDKGDKNDEGKVDVPATEQPMEESIAASIMEDEEKVPDVPAVTAEKVEAVPEKDLPNKEEKKETTAVDEMKPEDDKKDSAVMAEEEQPVASELKPDEAADESVKEDLPKDVMPESEPAPSQVNEEAAPIKVASSAPEEAEMPVKEDMPKQEEGPSKADDVPKTETEAMKEEERAKEVPKEENPLVEISETPKGEAEVPTPQSVSVQMEDTPKTDEIAAPESVLTPAKISEEDLPNEFVEKVSMAKFAKGEIKDEKKPTSVPKGEKKKDAEKKKGRSSEGSEVTDSRHPASGKSLLTSFNALYYKGEWQTPFDTKFLDDFHVGEGETKEVTVIRTQGDFRMGEIKELDAVAIDLPYKGEGGRYSLLVLLPRTQNGLPQLTAALSNFSMRNLAKYMREKQVDVTIPEFEIDCISHPETVFRKLGMSSMMDKDAAEFPGISKEQRLYLQDDAMAQLVRFRLDDDSAIANYLSTASMSTRSGLNVFRASHPFLFYLRDNFDNLTIVAGRVTDPSSRPEFSLVSND